MEVPEIAAARCSLTQLLAVPGKPIKQEGTIGGEGGDRDLDQPFAADVLGRDLEPIFERAAQKIGLHGPGRKLPARRTLLVVDLGQGLKLGGKLLLGVQPQLAARRAGQAPEVEKLACLVTAGLQKMT